MEEMCIAQRIGAWNWSRGSQWLTGSPGEPLPCKSDRICWVLEEEDPSSFFRFTSAVINLKL